MRIGYGKIGRSWKLDHTRGNTGSGDVDVARALHLLSRMRPSDEFVLVGCNSAEDPQSVGYPSNVVNPWTALRPSYKLTKPGSDLLENTERMWGLTQHMFTDVDAMIVWAGQHGTSNTPIPKVDDRSVVTEPQVSFINYCAYLLKGINRWRDEDLSREELWLCPDPRNYLKARDLKWPLRSTVIAQYEQDRETKHERYGDTTDPAPWGARWSGEGVWLAPSRYSYDALELTALPAPRDVETAPWDMRYDFGMVVNENRAYVARNRLDAVRDWVLRYWPEAEIFGVWSDKSKEALGRTDIRPCPYPHLPSTLQRWRCTLTTPASGTGWATAKPWECFANGVVCFFHPAYDTQNQILVDAPRELRDWLRVPDPEALHKRVTHLGQDRAAWEWLIATQRAYFVEKYHEHQGGVREIMRRLG